jgi:hypothetical protein
MPNNNDTHTIEENLQRLVLSRTAIAQAIVNKGGTVTDGDGFEDYPDDIATIPGGSSSTIIEKPDTITENGTYSAIEDNADGYSSVVVDVPNTYTSSDEGKVVSNGALVSQTSSSTTVNGVVDTTLINSLDVSVSTGMSNIEYNTDNDPVLTKTVNGTTTPVTTPDLTPTSGSKNLITSGAVHETIVDANTALELILYGYPYKDKDGTKPFVMCDSLSWG